MKRLFHTLLSSFIAATILIVGPMGHVSAMQSHGGMNHGGPSNMSEHCTMLCTSANPTKENKNKDDTPDDDDTPSPLYFQQFDSVHSGYFVEKSIVSRTDDPPKKVPQYRLCCVIRR
jgi:hypothetical protein